MVPATSSSSRPPQKLSSSRPLCYTVHWAQKQGLQEQGRRFSPLLKPLVLEWPSRPYTPSGPLLLCLHCCHSPLLPYAGHRGHLAGPQTCRAHMGPGVPFPRPSAQLSLSSLRLCAAVTVSVGPSLKTHSQVHATALSCCLLPSFNWLHSTHSHLTHTGPAGFSSPSLRWCHLHEGGCTLSSTALSPAPRAEWHAAGAHYASGSVAQRAVPAAVANATGPWGLGGRKGHDPPWPLPHVFPPRTRDATSLLVSPSLGGSRADTLCLGDGGGAAQHAVQVLLQALVLLRELLDAPGQAQEGAAHLLLPFQADFLLHWRPRDNKTKRLRFGALNWLHKRLQ